MTRLLAALLSLFALFSAYAQQAAPAETVQEPANMAVVIGFLVLFFGSIVGYVAYLVWQARKKPGNDE